MEEQSHREEYIQRSSSLPPDTGNHRPRPPDRLLAAQLYARGVPLHTVENALVLAASRRLFRPPMLPL